MGSLLAPLKEEEKEVYVKVAVGRWERQGFPSGEEGETGLQLGEGRGRGRRGEREVRPPRSTGQQLRGPAWRQSRPQILCLRILERRQQQFHSRPSQDPSWQDC